MNLCITSRRTTTELCLYVRGEIDANTTGRLDRAIAAALSTGADSLLVDLSGTTFCACAGITTLLTGRRDAIAHHVAYEVVNATGISLRALQIVGVHTVLATRTQRRPDDLRRRS